MDNQSRSYEFCCGNITKMCIFIHYAMILHKANNPLLHFDRTSTNAMASRRSNSKHSFIFLFSNINFVFALLYQRNVNPFYVYYSYVEEKEKKPVNYISCGRCKDIPDMPPWIVVLHSSRFASLDRRRRDEQENKQIVMRQGKGACSRFQTVPTSSRQPTALVEYDKLSSSISNILLLLHGFLYPCRWSMKIKWRAHLQLLLKDTQDTQNINKIQIG